jgi:response regulator RpfG family c-di-GMP phosphodiesterase
MTYKILFVDDETSNLRLLERLFRPSYEVFTASSGAEALELLGAHDVALIISDQRMPEMSGSEFLKRAAEMRPQTVRIMLTGYTDVNDLVDAINSGIVYKYITKPWVTEELQQTVRRSLQHFESTKAQRQLQLQCERLHEGLIGTREGFIDLVLLILNSSMERCGDHARRTADLCCRIAERLGMEWRDREQLSFAARLHDAVAFCRPDGSASGESSVTLKEAARGDVGIGLRALERIPGFMEVSAVLRFRFERFDGSGHPLGLAGGQIPLAARILSVAESYDKLRHPPGLEGFQISHGDVVRILEYESGKSFDPEIVRTVDDVLTKFEAAA